MAGEFDIPVNWTFESKDVAGNFDRHVREQLPWYDLATGVVTHLVRHYLPHGGLVYDVGASTGNIGRAIAPILEDRDALLVPIEKSPEMAAKYAGPGKVEVADAWGYPFGEFDVAILFLVLMFIPIPYRKPLIDRLRQRIRPGGCIIIFDKLAVPQGYLGTVLHRLTIAGKVATGVPAEEIVQKELSLSGVQRPVCEGHLGFDGRFQFWRFGEFAGWIIEG